MSHLRKSSCERLNSFRRSKTKRVYALVIVTGHEGIDPARDEAIYELKIGRIEVLVFVYNQVLDTQ